MNITKDGIDAILELSEGDMRRVLNILQSTSMAYPEVNSNAVYLCTGYPLPSDILTIKESLLNDSFNDCYNKITEIKTGNGLALNDILSCLVPIVYTISFPPKVLSYLLLELAELEYRLAVSTSENLQLSSLVAIFVKVRSMMESYN